MLRLRPDGSGVPRTSAALGDDLKCRPFRNKFLGPAQKNSTNSPKFLTIFFSHSPKNENFTLPKFYVTNCAAPSAPPPLSCAPPNFHLFCPLLKKILPFFNVGLNVTIFRKFSHFFRKCRPLGSAARGDSPPLPPRYATA